MANKAMRGRRDFPVGPFPQKEEIMSKRKKIIGAILVLSILALIFAPQVFSVHWDGYFTNMFVKGILRPQGQMQYRVVALSGTSPAGFSIGETDSGIIFTVDPTTYPSAGDGLKMNGTEACPIAFLSAGVTVTVAPSTSATGDRIIGIQNIGGTTKFVMQLTGALPIQTASGVSLPGIYDAEGDIAWLRLPYNGAVSAYLINQVVQ
jgi:hypothetical protein